MANITSKKLKIDSKVSKEFTYDEMLIQYEPLIGNIISTWSGFDSEEIKQLCYIGLWKAFKSYDIKRNISFGFYAKRIILNDIYQLGAETKKHCCVSLNSPMVNADNLEHIEMLLDNDINVDIENNTIYNIFISDYLQYFNEEYKKLFDLHFNKGYNQKQIAEIFHLTQPAISYRLKELINMLKRCYTFDTIVQFLPNKIKDDITQAYIDDNLHGYIKNSNNDKLYLTIKELSNSLKNINTRKDKTISNKCITWLEELYNEINSYIELLEIITKEEAPNKEIIDKIAIKQLNFFSQII